MINVDSVYQTVLALLNKEQRGSLPSTEFNLFGKQAQLDLFEKLFTDYAHFSVSRKGMVYDTGYSDIKKNIRAKIEIFETLGTLTPMTEAATQSFTGVSGTTYMLSRDATSVTSITVAGTAIASSRFTFTAPRTITFMDQTDAPVGSAIVVSFQGNTNTFALPSDLYRMDVVQYNDSTTLRVVEEMQKDKSAYIMQSSILQPKIQTPKFIRLGSNIQVFPNSIVNNVNMYYIREPNDPVWVGINGVYDMGTNSVDFDLHPSMEYMLVAKILQLSGLHIREEDVIAFAQTDLAEDQQIEKQ